MFIDTGAANNVLRQLSGGPARVAATLWARFASSGRAFCACPLLRLRQFSFCPQPVLKREAVSCATAQVQLVSSKRDLFVSRLLRQAAPPVGVYMSAASAGLLAMVGGKAADSRQEKSRDLECARPIAIMTNSTFVGCPTARSGNSQHSRIYTPAPPKLVCA